MKNRVMISFVDYLIHNQIQNEVMLLNQIATDVLGRKPTLGDGKDFTKIFQQGNDIDFEFAYKGRILGKVRTTHLGNVNFEPKEN